MKSSPTSSDLLQWNLLLQMDDVTLCLEKLKSAGIGAGPSWPAIRRKHERMERAFQDLISTASSNGGPGRPDRRQADDLAATRPDGLCTMTDLVSFRVLEQYVAATDKTKIRFDILFANREQKIYCAKQVFFVRPSRSARMSRLDSWV